MLLLQYSSPLIPQLSQQLLEEEKRQNLTSAGTGTAAVASGIVGAAAFCTPVGPPLLLGSMLFGTSATAIQVGSDARYFKLPAVQLANRLLALQGMVESILQIRNTLCAVATETATLNPMIDKQAFAKNEEERKEREQTFMGKTTGRLFKTGVGSLVTSATLSGAFLLWDSKNLRETVKAIKQGNRSEKAERLLNIQEHVSQLPKTEQLDEELQAYVKFIESNMNKLDQETVMQIVLDKGKEVSLAKSAEEPPISD